MKTRKAETKPSLIRRYRIPVIAAGVLLLAAGVWGVVAHSSSKVSLPKDLSVEALQAQSDDPGKVMDRVHQAMTSGNLTDEQRHALWGNVHTVMEAQMNKRMDEYFTAPEAQRRVILDRHIDEMQIRMKEFEQRRAQFEQERQARGAAGQGTGPGLPPGGTGGGRGTGPVAGTAGGRGPGPGPGGQAGGPMGGPDGGRRGDRFGPPSRQERKVRSESRDPDQMARRMTYFTAMRKRAEERGIELNGPMMRVGGR
jgi:hypothetical protein